MDSPTCDTTAPRSRRPRLVRGADKASFARGFSKDDSACLKGIGIVLMLFHHLFDDQPEYAGYVVSYAPFTGHRLGQLALLAKICVALFVFVTGYGLTLSYRSQRAKGSFERVSDYLRFALTRWWALMTQYWAVFAVALVCQPLGRTIADAYGAPLRDSWRFFAFDVAGISFAARAPSLNPTWWYMTLAIWFIFLVPLVNVLADHLGTVPVLGAWGAFAVVYGYGDTYGTYLIVALVGVAMARTRAFSLLDAHITHTWQRVLVGFCALACAAVLLVLRLRGHMAFGLVDGLVALLMACACHELVAGSLLAAPLRLLGDNSTNMFLFHTPIYSYYFLGFFYGWRYWWLILLSLVVASLAFSLGLDWLKERSGYQRLMGAVGARIGSAFVDA